MIPHTLAEGQNSEPPYFQLRRGPNSIDRFTAVDEGVWLLPPPRPVRNFVQAQYLMKSAGEFPSEHMFVRVHHENNAVTLVPPRTQQL